MTSRDAFAWAIGSIVDAVADLPASILAVELMQTAARLIAETGALPHRCDRAAKLFRQMIAEQAAGAPFPVSDAMIEAWDDAPTPTHHVKRATARSGGTRRPWPS